MINNLNSINSNFSVPYQGEEIKPVSFFNPRLIETTRIETYDDLIINLNRSQQIDLERQMEYLNQSNSQINLSLVVQALSKSLLKHPIWRHAEFPLYALLALKHQLIDGMDFTTSQLFHNVMTHPHHQGQIKEIPLLIDHHKNQEAQELIDDTLTRFISQKAQEINQKKGNCFLPFMDDEQKEYFWDAMSQLSPLQQKFLLVPDSHAIDYARFKKLKKHKEVGNTITEIIQTQSSRFNVFCRISDKIFGQPFRMIPSKGMLQAYLFATGGDCTLMTQFGLSSLDILHAGLARKERPFCLNFKYLPKVTEADTFDCLDKFNEVEYHDFYHIDIMNLIGEDISKFDGFSRLLQNLMNQRSPIIKSVVQQLYELIIDMEHMYYDKYYSSFYSKSLPNDALFWATINAGLRGIQNINNTSAIILLLLIS